tara:strand:- start:534 stop:755 length:222 start_codon:yes stop_codon:yes gene_type:complete
LPNPLCGKEALNKEFLIVLLDGCCALLRRRVLVLRVYINDEKRHFILLKNRYLRFDYLIEVHLFMQVFLAAMA